MDIKWVGAILIIVSCGGCGFTITAGIRREEMYLSQLMGTLQFMEAELRYRLTPLPELCRIAAGQTRGKLQAVFLNLYRELSWQTLPDAGSCMHAAVRRSGDLPPRIRKLLIQLGHSLGQFDLSGQLQGIQTVKKRCEDYFTDIRKNRGERIRNYQTLGICGGTALAIILL